MTTKNNSAAAAKQVENKRPGFFLDLMKRLILEKPQLKNGWGYLMILSWATALWIAWLMLVTRLSLRAAAIGRDYRHTGERRR
jgi:hypothetical protein